MGRTAANITITLAFLCGAAVASAEPLLDISTTNAALKIARCAEVPCVTIVGWEFSATTAFTVDALGIFDFGGDGLISSHDVGLWTSGGTLLASATITNGNSTAVTSAATPHQWLFTSIAPLALLPGSYVVGAAYAPGDGDNPIVTSDPTIMPVGFNFLGERIEGGVAGLVFPSSSPIASSDGLFGPNLSIAAAPVPEPASLAMLAVGLFGIAARQLRPRK